MKISFFRRTPVGKVLHAMNERSTGLLKLGSKRAAMSGKGGLGIWLSEVANNSKIMRQGT